MPRMAASRCRWLDEWPSVVNEKWHAVPPTPMSRRNREGHSYTLSSIRSCSNPVKMRKPMRSRALGAASNQSVSCNGPVRSLARHQTGYRWTTVRSGTEDSALSAHDVCTPAI
jgi:hypothetical protein